MAPGSQASHPPAPPPAPEEHGEGGTASAAPAAYRPPPRPPAEPERPWWRTGTGWRTAAGWVVLLGVVAFFGSFFYRLSTEVDQRAGQEEEVEREHEQVLRAIAWVQDTAATPPVPESGPPPTSALAKRIWVIRRMLVDRAVWEREVRKRHGAESFNPPAAWTTARYQANARSYPEIARYVEGRVSAAAEIQKTSAAWMDERTAALARESGLPAAEISEIFPRDLGGVPSADARLAEAMRDVHRHLVSMDPRVEPAGGDELLFQREADLIRFNDLTRKFQAAADSANQAREQRLTREISAVPRVVRVIRTQ